MKKIGSKGPLEVNFMRSKRAVLCTVFLIFFIAVVIVFALAYLVQSHREGSTVLPTATESPVLTEPPTATPVPTPTPEPAVVTTGSFSANADAALDLMVDWTAETTGDNTAITFRVLLSSYSLYSSEAPGDITVNGTKYSFLSPDIRYDGNSRIETEIYTCTVNIPLEGGSGDIPVSAYWQFKGKYGGVTFDDLRAEHTIHIG